MVCYCCVKGCSNNSNIKKKDPSNNTSFHAFPSNQELRIKWLRAIGRPNWEPPSHARICSAHFNYEQINHDSCRIRIKDDACPVNALPPNSNFEASYVEVCRICLATDLKMYSLENGRLRDCLESIAGFNENYNIEGLPQFVCYECAAHLTKCYNLIERSMTAQAILLDIFAQNGHLVEEHSNEDVFHGIDDFKNDESDNEIMENISMNVATADKNSVANEEHENIFVTEFRKCKIHHEILPKRQENKNEKKSKRKSLDGLTPDEVSMQEYFNIVKLTLQEQMEEWKKTMENRPWKSDTVHKCEVCSKIFAHVNTYRIHVIRHDPSRGKAECPVCKLRFKNEVIVKSHANRTHGKKFYCKSCPKIFSNVAVAKKHQKWHSGHRYACTRTLADQDPALKTTCKSCGADFTTTAELTQHVRAEHRKVTKKKTGWRLPDDSYPTQCEHCGESLGSRGEHWRHVRRLHPRHAAAYRRVVTAVCDTCGKGFQSSTKLRLHLLRHARPSLRCATCGRRFYDKYALARHAAAHSGARPHVCRCGRAFKLRAHLLRHNRVHTGATPYECPMCDKKFKYSTSVNLHVRTVHYKLPHPPRKKRTNKSAINIDDNNDM
ncbi:uncharacterized protein ACR2FA_006271 [Aphomia sociella]